jgi:hypothetical protein
MNPKIFLIFGAILLSIGGYLLINSFLLEVQQVGEYTFKGAAQNYRITSIPILAIGAVLLVIGIIKDKD